MEIKAFDKSQHPFLIKILTEVGTEGTCLHTTKAIYDKSITTVILNSEAPKASSLKSGTRQGCPLSPFLFKIVLQVLAMAVRQKRKRKVTKLERKRQNCRYMEMT